MFEEGNDNEDRQKSPLDFYEMVKKWTKYDYETPGIKAEVIIDMLISEFIKEIVEVGINLDSSSKTTVKLLAKEFPIYIDSNRRNAKVDYLLLVENNGNKTVFLTELKSSKESYKSEQLERMNAAVGKGINDLIRFYVDVAFHSNQTEKYRRHMNEFCKKISGSECKIRKCRKSKETCSAIPKRINNDCYDRCLIDECASLLIQAIGKAELKTLYVCLDDYELQEGVDVIVLNEESFQNSVCEIIKDEKRKLLWNSICGILNSL